MSADRTRTGGHADDAAGPGRASTHPGEPTWEPPGPGTWELDSSHSPPSPTRAMRRIGSESATNAYRWAFATYGGPLDTIAVAFVHGKMYRRLVPLVGGDRSGPPPPSPLLWLVSRLHPAFRRRDRLARETLENQSFLEPIDRWESSERQEWVDASLAFQREPVGELDDAGLADHLRRIGAHTLAGWTRHHQLHATDLGPIGDLLAHTSRWGLDPREVMRAMAGASPATTEPAELAEGIAAALADAGVDPAAVPDLDEVRGAGPEVARRLDDYLERFGWRIVTSYDIEGATVGELPGATVAMIRAAGTRASRPRSPEAPVVGAPAAVVDQLRVAVPEGDRATFDTLLGAARRAYGLRDDNGPLTAEWPMGLLRRAYLEAGNRLAGRNRLTRPDDAFELDVEELAAVLEGAAAPDTAEIARRAEHRRWEAGLTAPEVLGPVAPPPAASLLPGGLRRMVEAVTAAVELLEPDREAARPGLSGMGIGTSPYTGRARVARRPEDVLGSMEPGEVLVAAWTAPTFNAVLAIAGAVVVQEGGVLCHAAVMARELGLPAVIGCAGALDELGDGDLVEVDPAAGRVTVVERAAPVG